jgi:tetratricopeptide (TPR) repeat protein
MASQEDSEQDGSAGKDSKRRLPLKDNVVKRLAKCLEHATTQATAKKFDYATDLYLSCLNGDPGNLLYLQGFIANLKAKYGDPKKIGGMAQFGARGGRAAVKKAISQCAWDDALKAGWEVLKGNPWDVQTLVSMAAACEGAAAEGEGPLYECFLSCQLYYLKCAYEAAPKDADTCRTLANALHKQNRLDDSISFWHKVEQIRPNDDEAAREIASLLVEKQVNEQKGDQASGPVGKKEELTPEERLKRRVDRQPEDISGYHELAQFYLNADRYKDAEEVYKRALGVSKNDPELIEKVESVQVQSLRSQAMKAKAKFDSTGAEADKKEFERLRRLELSRELEMLRNRCERFPSQLVFRYDLAVRYQSLGEYQKAITEFQMAKNDPRKKGLCLLKLGECFRSIKQYQLGLRHFEEAIDEIPDRDMDNKKTAMYNAGKLALGLGLLDQAEKHLSRLAGLDFGYRDGKVSELLEEIQRRRKGASGQKDGKS